MKATRKRARAGELRAFWGRLPGEGPDLIYMRGEGVPRADAHLLHNALTMKHWRPLAKLTDAVPFEPSFVEELQRRGYDLTTLEFRVRKKSEVGKEEV